MTRDATLDELLARREQARSRGEDLSADELCAHCPELLADLKRVLGEPDAETPTETRAQPPMTDAAAATEVSPADGCDDESTEDLTGFLAPPRGPEELGRLGDFRVVKLLGAGGMGAVFQAVDERLGRSVAIKTLRPRLAASPAARKRFLREARAAAALSHDHVVAVYHVGEERGVPFLVMPFLHGQSLDDHLRNEVRLPVRAVLRITREIADGLSAAHERGMVHRDIKPANVWLEAPRDRVKILDFGLAHTAETQDVRLTQTGAVMGTPMYMSPEQAQGEPVDHRTDLYSLGAVAYRMAAGRAPFQGKSSPAILAAVVRDEPVSLRSLAPDLPPALDALIMRLLAKDPSARPDSARAVVETIDGIEHELAAAVPPSQVEPPTESPVPSPSPNRKRPRTWAALALALIGLIGGGAVLSQVVIRLKNKDGTETEIKVPATTKVEVENAGKVTVFPARRADATPKEAISAKPVSWMPGSPEGSLPGLFPRQAWLPGIGRWQVETIAPRSDARGLAWSSRGEIAVGDRSGTIRVYDAAMLTLKRLIHQGTGIGINAIVWNPAGTDLAVASDDPAVRVWRADGSAVEFPGHDSGGSSAAWSPDGKRLASAGADGSVRIWQADGQPGPVLNGHEGEVLSVAWSPDGKRLASGGADKTVRIWDVEGKPGPVLRGHTARILAVAWHPKDGRLASGGEDKDVRTWNADGTAGSVLNGHGNAIWALAWSPNGSRLLSASSDGTARLWDAASQPGTVLVCGYTVYAAAWSPDGLRIVTWDGSGSLRLWDIDGNPILALQGPSCWLSDVTWNGDGTQLMATRTFSPPSGPGLVTLSADGRPAAAIRAANGGPVSRAAWSPKGTRLAACGTWGPQGAWLVALLQPDGQVERLLPGSSGSLRELAWAPDGTRLAAAYEDSKDVRVWDADGTAGPVLATGTIQYSAAWSPDGARLAAVGDDGKIRTWASDGKPGPILEGHTGHVYALAWRPGADVLTSGGTDGTIRFWERGERPGKLITPRSGQIFSLSWEPGGARLASGDTSGAVRLWSAAGEPCGVLKDHDRWVYAVAWSPRGDKIASLDFGAKIVVWDANTEEPHWTAIPLSGDRVAVFTPGGTLLHGDAEAIDKELVFTVEDERGRLELLTRTAFLKRAEEARLTAAQAPAGDAVDYAAERKAAEWLLQKVKRGGGSFDVADGEGKPIGSFGKKFYRWDGFFPRTDADGNPAGSVDRPALSKLPDEPFVVESVSLLKGFVSDRELHHLSGCRRIRDVDLSENSEISSRGLQALRGCRTLTRLELHATAVGDGIGGLLASWPELEQLGLLGCQLVSDAAMPFWPDFPRLRRLHISNLPISDSGLAHIVQHGPNLDEVHIETDPSNSRPPLVATLTPLRDLRSVAFGTNQLSDEGVTALRGMPHLKRAWIGWPLTDQDIKRLEPLGEKLAVLEVYCAGEGVTDAGYAVIARMSELRELILRGGKGSPSDEDLGRLAQHSGLRSLTLDVAEPDPRRYTAAGIAAFRQRRPDVVLTVDGTTYPATAPAPPSP